MPLLRIVREVYPLAAPPPCPLRHSYPIALRVASPSAG